LSSIVTWGVKMKMRNLLRHQNDALMYSLQK
jgi:hypothetical protein